MKVIDIVILIPLLYGAYNGFKRGLVLEIIAIIAFVVATILGFKFLGWGLVLLKPYLGENNKLLTYFSFFIVFFPILFLINKIGSLLRKSFRYSLLGGFDSMAGALLGICTWAFGISVFLWLANAVNAIPKSAKKETYIYPVVAPVAPKVISKLSEYLPLGSNLLIEIKKSLKPDTPNNENKKRSVDS